MTRRVARFVLLLSLAAGFAAATFLLVDGERRAAATRQAAMEFDAHASGLARRLAQVSAGQQAYVAPDQDPGWWRTRVISDLTTVQSQLDRLRERASDPGGLSDLDAAVAGTEALRDVDGRAGRLLADDRQRQAATLIYREALATAASAARHVEAARIAQLQAFERVLDGTRRREIAVVAAAALLAFVVAGLLLRTGEPAEVRASVPDPAVPEPEPKRTVPAATRREPAPLAAEAPQPAAEPTTIDTTPPFALTGPHSDAQPPPELLRDRRRAPELRAAADLCTDFARLIDGQELPALLERASGLLDATGLIVWVAEQDGAVLRPLLAHGYTQQALSRLPAIPREADNATAAAYRDSRLEIVTTNGMSPGALVVPLIGAGGCVGVVAAEVRHGREASESVRALARIVAAQLATLVAITPGEERAPAHSAVG